MRFAGLVRMRQRPETASGVTFVTLEDEHCMVNAVVWQRTAEEQRRELLESSLMAIDGRLERADGVQHLIVSRMENYGGLLAKLQTGSRDFQVGGSSGDRLLSARSEHWALISRSLGKAAGRTRESLVVHLGCASLTRATSLLQHLCVKKLDQGPGRIDRQYCVVSTE